MNSLLKDSANFSSLSLKDLLAARDLFHYHLLSKKNVSATAVGLYRIRQTDPWPKFGDHNPKPLKKTVRTLFNSEVRPYSWPCIYVFVDDWAQEDKLPPTDVVPKTLFLPDGRTVPVCVIEAQKNLYDPGLDIDSDNLFPRNVFIPGSPLINPDGQGMPRYSTVGAIVKDGEKYYALTNKHAVGEPGTVIEGVKNNQTERIGVTSKKSITRKPFGEIYPNFASTNQYLHMDIGLVEVDDIKLWKTEIISIGEVESVLDLYDNNLTLQLIGKPVTGFGAVSGRLNGEIQGLFYRYKAQGGYEYLSDFLIGPRTQKSDSDKVPLDEKLIQQDVKSNKGFFVGHGDSGALLCIVQEPDPANKDPKSKTCYYPFAILWGKNEFFQDGNRLVQPFALATSLSTALEKLELDFVRDINMENDLIWGYIGHYAIASKLKFTIDLIGSKKLSAFILKNNHLLAMADSDIKSAAASPKVVQKDASGNDDPDSPHFVPLADVPDNVWKSNVNFYNVKNADGTSKRHTGPGARGQYDNPNHFADVDLPRDSDYKTLLELSLPNDFKFLNPADWLSFYKEVAPKYEAWNELFTPKAPFNDKKHWGALPFRVAQIVDLMIGFAGEGNQNEFLCAGGVLIHYVGDACQPLHSSYKSQGDPDHPVTRKLSRGPNAGTEVTEVRGAKVHGGYEDDMINTHSKDIMNALEAEIKRQDSVGKEKIRQITDGKEASKAIIELIDATQKTLTPEAIINKWVEVQDLKGTKARNDAMWADFGDPTIEVMARGCRVLAAIWQGAWDAGNGDKKIGNGSQLQEQDIEDLYNDSTFLPSISLDKY